MYNPSHSSYWDGHNFYFVTTGVANENDIAGSWRHGIVLLSTITPCDCRKPLEFSSIQTLTLYDESLSSEIRYSTLIGSVAQSSYQLLFTSVEAFEDYFDPNPFLTCDDRKLEFIPGCLTNISVMAGDPDVILEPRDCVIFDGMTLVEGGVYFGAIASMTDISNGNVLVRSYSYTSQAQVYDSLIFMVSRLEVPVPKYTIEVIVKLELNRKSFYCKDQITFEVIAPVAPVISIPPAATHELGEGLVAFPITASDYNSDPLTVAFESDNELLNACCSISNQGGDNFSLDCNCNDLSLVDGDNDKTYTVTLVANDGTLSSEAVIFDLTITSPNKKPKFYNLVSAITVKTGTNPFVLYFNYRDLNLGDKLTFTYNIPDPIEALTMLYVANKGD